MVLFACPHFGLVDREKFHAVKDAIFRTVATSRDVVLVVKPHPGEKPHETERLARGYPNTIIADARADIRGLILACDAFITLGSTSTMDALLAGKPVIWPDLAGLVWWDDNFINSGATLVVRSEQELARSFDCLADGSIAEVMLKLKEDRQRFLEGWVFRADGRASERIADLALAIIRQGRNRAAGDFTEASHAGYRDSLVAEDQ
jgi:CDP-glycerol glycerophosphotransferase (TagB/SpsB family)